MHESTDKPAIYISYAWGSRSEAIAESIEKEFLERNLPIIRDKNVLGYKGRIKAFMELIGRAKYVILVISNKYLHSVNCMFELVQIFKNEQFYERVFPVVLDEVNIADPSERVKLTKYWENETESLSDEIKQLNDLSNIQGLTDDLNLNTEIRNNIARLTNILKDTNTLSIDELAGSNFEQLYSAICVKISTDVPQFTKNKGQNDLANVEDDGAGESEINKPIKWIVMVVVLSVLAFVGYQAIGNNDVLEDEGKAKDSTAIAERKKDSLRIIRQKNIADSLKKLEAAEKKSTVKKLSGVRYDVELVVPSHMAQANVFVDGERAEIIERSLISITVRIRKKDSGHHFEVKNGDETCLTDKLITKSGVRLTLCD